MTLLDVEKGGVRNGAGAWTHGRSASASAASGSSGVSLLGVGSLTGSAAGNAAGSGRIVRLAYGLVIVALAMASALALLAARLDADAASCAAGAVNTAGAGADAAWGARLAALVGQGVPVLDGAAPARVPRGLRVAVLTLYVRGEDPRGPSNRTRVVNYADKTADIADIALRNMADYCDMHGYDLIVVDHSLDAGRPLAWSKLVAMMRHLPDYDWLLYMDADALFTNFSVTVEERAHPPHGGATHCRRTDDAFGRVRESEFFVGAHAINDTLNSGVLLMKNTTRVMDLLVALYASYTPSWNGLQDNRAVSSLLAPETAPDFVCRLKGDYARWLQSSVHTTQLDQPANYVPGDWIVHFAGPCAPWCRVAAQLANICATYPGLPECKTALTRVGWQPMSPYGKILDVQSPATAKTRQPPP